MVLPIIALESYNVEFIYTQAQCFGRFENDEKNCQKPVIQDGDDVSLSRDDLVFVTNGSVTESSTYGSQDRPAPNKRVAVVVTMENNLAEQFTISVIHWRTFLKKLVCVSNSH